MSKFSGEKRPVRLTRSPRSLEPPLVAPMTVPYYDSEDAARVSAVGLFPGLVGDGGIQEAARHTAAALDVIARRSHGRTCFLTLNDPKGVHSIATDGCEITYRGFARDKLHFAAAAIRAARQASARLSNFPPLLLAAHPNLAPPAAVARFFSPRCTLAVQSHGIEVWRPLSFLRRSALVSAALVLAPSRHTAQQLSSVQRVIETRIAVLPWPLSSEFFGFAACPDGLPPPPGFPLGRVVLTVGRLDSAERYKGTDELLLALSRLRASYPDLHLAIVGRGNDLSRLRQLAANLGVSEFVHFLGASRAKRSQRVTPDVKYLRCRVRAKGLAWFFWKRWRSQNRWWRSQRAARPISFKTASTVCWSHRRILGSFLRLSHVCLMTANCVSRWGAAASNEFVTYTDSKFSFLIWIR